MKHRKIILIFVLLLLMIALSTTAFAIDESEVESAIASSGEDAVAGNLFIWFLCAVSFLKISQKIDSFMTSLGINVGRTGGSMMAEMLIAGRALGGAARATGSAVGNIFNRGHTTNQAAGQALFNVPIIRILSAEKRLFFLFVSIIFATISSLPTITNSFFARVTAV